MFILIYFFLLFVILVLLGNRSVALLFLGIQIISLLGSFFIGLNYPIESLFNVFNLLLTIFILSLIILPWIRVSNVHEIYSVNESKVNRLTYFLIFVSVLPFIIFSAVATFVMLYVEDISAFKYAEGVSTDFYYSLPINTKLLIISNYLYNFSYFLIPLHFYYLGKNRIWLSVVCLIFSLNIILFGLTYFSRSVFVHYILIYVSFMLILYPTLTKGLKRFIKVSILVVGIVFTSYFIYISFERFTDDQQYAEIIPQESIIQDPVLYSYFDYLSQWYYNNMYVLDAYSFTTFRGETSLKPVLELLGQYGIVSFNYADYLNLRMQLWPSHWYLFNGFVAYSVYDYGYTITILLSVIYFYIVLINRPTNNRISISKLLLLVLLIQLPLMAIFYSNVGGIVIPLILLIPIYFYLKIKIN